MLVVTVRGNKCFAVRSCCSVTASMASAVRVASWSDRLEREVATR